MVGDKSANPYNTINTGDNKNKSDIQIGKLTEKVSAFPLHNRSRFLQLVVIRIRCIVLLSFDSHWRQIRQSTKSETSACE